MHMRFESGKSEGVFVLMIPNVLFSVAGKSCRGMFAGTRMLHSRKMYGSN